MNMETKFKIGDTIYWYCDMDQKVHEAEVSFVNYAGAGYPDISYEVECVCCGEKMRLFVDEEDAFETDLSVT